MKKTVSLVIILLLNIFLFGCVGEENKDMIENDGEQLEESYQDDKSEEEVITSLVKEFGTKLQEVSLLAPKEAIKKSMEESYGKYVSKELLENWIKDPLNAPGRLTSSPWPDRIEIQSIEKTSEVIYEVKGRIIEITSREKTSGGVAASRPITLMVKKIDKRWLINNVTIGDYEDLLKDGEIIENQHGVFKGFIDEKSVEILLGEAVPLEFEYLEELTDEVKHLKEGDKITISYIKKVEGEGPWYGHMLTEIERLTESTKFPEKKMLKMMLEGMEEEREATLYESKYGYYIYILNNFSFNETETGTSYITMDYDEDFNVRIDILPNDINHDEWKKSITKELEKFEEVNEIDPKEHFDPYFRDAYYYYMSSDANRNSVMYMMKEIDGVLFQFRIDLPLKEAMEGAWPSFWTMLKTISLK